MSGGFYTNLGQLPGPQSDALIECVRAGGLKRISRGYTSVRVCGNGDLALGPPINTRTVKALVRADLMQVVEAEGMVTATQEGRALVDGDQFA